MKSTRYRPPCSGHAVRGNTTIVPRRRCRRSRAGIGVEQVRSGPAARGRNRCCRCPDRHRSCCRRAPPAHGRHSPAPPSRSRAGSAAAAGPCWRLHAARCQRNRHRTDPRASRKRAMARDHLAGRIGIRGIQRIEDQRSAGIWTDCVGSAPQQSGETLGVVHAAGKPKSHPDDRDRLRSARLRRAPAEPAGRGSRSALA